MTKPNDKCVVCGKEFYRRPFEKRSGRRTHCSIACSTKAIRDLSPQANRICIHCGTQYRVNPAYIARRPNGNRFCSRKCWLDHMRTPSPGLVGYGGYREMRGVKTREHRYVMENVLGRKLSTNEHVHHINHDKLDNRPGNLVVLTPDEHRKIHPGRYNTGKEFSCDVCGKRKYYPPAVFSVLGKRYRCLPCRKKHGFAPNTGPKKRDLHG